MTEGISIYRGRSSEQVKIDLLHEELDQANKLLRQYRDEYTKLMLSAALARATLRKVKTGRRFFPDLKSVELAKNILDEIFK